jgi:hypothetical protein
MTTPSDEEVRTGTTHEDTILPAAQDGDLPPYSGIPKPTLEAANKVTRYHVERLEAVQGEANETAADA